MIELVNNTSETKFRFLDSGELFIVGSLKLPAHIKVYQKRDADHFNAICLEDDLDMYAVNVDPETKVIPVTVEEVKIKIRKKA